METAMRDKPFWRSRWWMPLFSLALGGAMFAAYAIGGDPGEGVFSLRRDGALAALFLFGGRSETLRGLGGPGRDERWAAIDLRATRVRRHRRDQRDHRRVPLARSPTARTASPYAQLGAIGGVAYIAAVAFLRWRS